MSRRSCGKGRDSEPHLGPGHSPVSGDLFDAEVLVTIEKLSGKKDSWKQNGGKMTEYY